MNSQKLETSSSSTELVHSNLVESGATAEVIVSAIVVLQENGIIHAVAANGSADISSLHSLIGLPLSSVYPDPNFAQKRIAAALEAIRSNRILHIEEVVAAGKARRKRLLTTFIPLLRNNDEATTEVLIIPEELNHDDSTGHRLSTKGIPKQEVRQMLLAQEEERHRISREIHDSLCQALALLRMDIRYIVDHLQGGQRQLKSKCLSAIHSLSSLIEEARRIAANLAPAILDDLGLCAALRSLATDLTHHQPIALSVALPEDCDEWFTKEHQLHIYRIVQEALANIAKHSQARSASLSVVQGSNAIRLTISDDGNGCDLTEKRSSSFPQSLGLRDMKERTTLLGGTLNIESTRRKGTTIQVTIPVRHLKTISVEA